ncbi:MAG: hypothetical protein D6693_03520 [Planctomycetota bacterium]|nr:MAG: hypothetical protein D6693_03520 [Planctomycetota bacterium]
MLRRAKRHAGRFGRLTLFDSISEEWVCRCVELPDAIGAGATAREAEKALTENLTVWFAYLEEQGEPWPEPASAPRSEQVNVRLTAQERAEFEAAAKRMGLSSVADLIRLGVLDLIRAQRDRDRRRTG